MEVESQNKAQSNVLYNKNDFLLIHDSSAADFFSLALVTTKVLVKDTTVRVIFMERYKEHRKDFHPVKEGLLKMEEILEKTDDVVVAKASKPKEGVKSDIKVYLTATDYNRTKDRVKEILKKRGLLDIDDEEAEEDDEVVDRQLISQMMELEIVKVKRKSTQPAARVKKPKKVNLPKFKKGTTNPWMGQIEYHKQFDDPSNEPKLTADQKNNNKELIRAVNIGSLSLVKEIIKRSDQISTIGEFIGPQCCINPYTLALKTKQYDIFFYLKEIESDKNIRYAKDQNSGFKYVDTGFNDKYAYGVATRAVSMSRGNREGTNALMMDQSRGMQKYNSDENIAYFLKHVNDPEIAERLIALNPNGRGELTSRSVEALLAGNNVLAGFLLKIAFEQNGYGLNQYFSLGCLAESVDQLADLKKANAKKKSYLTNQFTALHCACLNPNGAILERYLDIGEEMYITDEMLRKPVHYAACCSSTEPLKILLERGIDCRDYDKNKMTPLMYAASSGRIENIIVMCNHVAYNVNLKSKEGYAAIHYAALNNHVDCVRELVQRGSDPNLTGKQRMTPLMVASAHGHFETVQYLLENGAKVLKNDAFKRSALIHAVMNCQMKIASHLLVKGADFNGSDSSKNFPLHYAAAYGSEEILDMLIQAGADVNSVNSWNMTPILTALLKNHYGCLSRLTTYADIDVNCQDNNGSTLLASCFAKFEKSSYDFAKFLMEHKEASPNISDFNGNNCLHLLAAIDIESLFQDKTFETYKEYQKTKAEMKELYAAFFHLLIENGVEFNQPNSNLVIPLTLALQKSNTMFLDLALQLNVELKFIPQTKNTILHYCDKIISLKNGPAYIEAIIRKTGSLQDTSDIVDEEGLNHFLFLVQSFTKWAPDYETIKADKKKAIIQQIIDTLAQEDQENVDKKNKHDKAIIQLQTKLNKISASLETLSQLKNQNFISIIEIFDRNNYDFSIKVSVLKTQYVPKRGDVNLIRSYNIEQYNPNRNQSIVNVYSETGSETQKVDIVVNNNAGSTGLHLLLQSPHKDVLNYYVNMLSGKRLQVPNDVNYFGESVWWYLNGIHSDAVEAVKLLYGIQENPNISDKKGNYPFLKLIKNAKIEVIDEMLKLGVDLDVQDVDGISALIFYAKSRNLTQIQKLIKTGCDINILDKRGRNALHWAINNNLGNDTTFEVEECLLSNNIQINVKDVKQRYPIHYFFTKIDNTGISTKTDPIELLTDFLLYENIEIDSIDEYGRSPLSYAAQRGAYLCASALVNRGCNIDNVDMFNNTVFNLALINNHIDIAILLIQKSAKITNAVNIVNYEAMSEWKKTQEANKKKMEIEQEIIEMRKSDLKNDDQDGSKSANKNRPFPSKRNPYRFNQQAAEEEVKPAVKFTEQQLQEMADKNFVDKNLTPFKLALEKESDPIKYLLIDQGFDVALATMDAFDHGSVQYSVKLLSKKFSMNLAANNKKYQSVNHFGQNLFHVFAKNSAKFDKATLEKVFNMLVDKEISIDVEDETGTPPLIYAAVSAQNSTDLMEYMVRSGADPNSTDVLGNTVLSALVQNNTALKHKVFVDSTLAVAAVEINNNKKNVPSRGRKMLAKKRMPAHINMIPAKSAKFGFSTAEGNQNDDNASLGQTPKMFIEWLTNFISTYDVNVNFDFEIRTNSLNQNETFMDKSTGSKHFSLLSYIVIKLRNPDLLRLVIEAGANINQQDAKGQTILTYAIKNNILPLISFLKNYENLIDFSIVDKKGKTYIHLVVSPFKSASYQNVNLLEYLTRFVDINKPDLSGHSPVYYAQQQESEIMYNKLLQLGANAFASKDVVPEPVHITASQIFPQKMFDFEEDYNAYIESVKENEKDIEVEEKEELDRRIHGRVKLVYDINKKPYKIALLKVEVNYGYYSSNVFYRMQIAFEELRKVYILFTNWGRMGTEGQHQLTPFYNLDDCRAEFHKIFREKTGNDYPNIDNFHPILKKYNLIRIIKHVHNKKIIEKVQIEGRGLARSRIPEELQQFMKNLLDSSYYLTVFRTFNIVEKAMSLGAIPMDVLLRAQELLISIKEILIDMAKNKATMTSNEMFERATQIADHTSRYYELIPTNNYTTRSIPVFNIYRLKSEIERMTDLINLERGVKLMIASQQRKKDIHPFDYCIKNLNIKIIRLDENSEEFAIIRKYVKCGFNGYKKDTIRNVYAIERKDEAARFSKWENTPNRRLLFHGTRTENILTIMQQGLRIGVSEAQENGNSYGNGVYFSDAFCNSVTFSNTLSTDSKKPIYLLLCEVACGKIKKLYNTVFHHPPLSDCNSIKGIGQYKHDSNKRVYLNDGCMVPLGNLISKTAPKDKNVPHFTHSYNQFVIFDLSQIKIRYILEINPNEGL